MPLTRSPDRAEQELLGKAIRQLRLTYGLKQADIAAALQITTQAWQKYETGERKFTADKMPVILQALGASPSDLEGQRLALLGRDPEPEAAAPQEPFFVEVRGRTQFGPEGFGEPDSPALSRQVDLRQLLGQGVRAVEVAGDEMSPWAEPGEIVLYDRDRYPKRGQGCVVEMKSGERYVRKYEGSDGSTLFVRILNPEKVESIALADAKGVYPIRLRGD